MRAAVVTALGGPEVLAMVEQPDPVPAPGEVLVRVRAIPLVQVDRPALAELIDAVAKGRLRTRVAATLPPADAAEAHRRVEAGHLRGKIVLVP